MILRPQKGPQEQFLATKADIAIYGCAAGRGKTYALLLEPLRHMNVEGYSATIFRKNATQITIDGGLLDVCKCLPASYAGWFYRVRER